MAATFPGAAHRRRRAPWLLVLALVLLLPVFAASASAQNSNGTEFWLAFPSNIGTPELTLFIAGSSATSGTVDIPGLGFSQSFDVTPGQVTAVSLPSDAVITSNDAVSDNGIHVTAKAPVTVYGLNRIQATTDAYLGLPLDAIGTDYIDLGYTGNVAPSEFAVVATQDGTTVTITPTAAAGSAEAGTPFQVTLSQGQTYQLQASGADLSGTIITSNNPIAVFGGAACVDIPTGDFACDHVVEQLPPTTEWGKSFVTMPLATRQNGDTFRILAAQDDTTVQVNGETVATLNRGQFREQIIAGPSQIIADKPVLVMQYSNSSSYDNVTSDPFQMMVPPYEQFLASYTVSTPASGFSTNFVNVVAPAADVGSVILDGSAIPSDKFTPIANSGFSGAQLPVALGSHTLSAPLPFGVSTYGFDSYDSYGYPGGLGVSEVATVTKVTASPADGSGVVGSQQCVDASVTDQNGGAVKDIRVDFSVTGANSATGFDFTNSDGNAQFCYTGTNVGDDRVTAAVGDLRDTVSRSWTAAPPTPTTLTASPETGSAEVGSQQCVTANLEDQYGKPMSGIQVGFVAAGTNDASGSETTGADGNAQFCYSGSKAGDDTVTASVGNLSDSVTRTWTAAAPRPTTLTAAPQTGTAEVGSQQCVTVTVRDQNGAGMGGVTVTITVKGVNTGGGSGSTNDNGEAQFCYTGTNAGDDTVTASVGDLSASVTRTWTPQPPRATTLTVSPKEQSGELGSEQCVTATVDDQNGAAMSGVQVGFVVTGANGGEGVESTNSDGNAEFCYSGTKAGDDTVTASAGELSDSAAVTWTEPAPVPTTLSVSPKEQSGQTGTQQCVTATVDDQNGDPLPETTVDFASAGVNSAEGSQSTGSDGTAQFCYSGANAGDDTVTASAGKLSDSAAVTWTAPPPPPPQAASVTASPKTGSGEVGTQQCVTATVDDQNGKPFAGADVSFTVTGANSATGSKSTASDGTADFCYSGANTGDDTVKASVGDLSDSVTRTWTAAPPPPPQPASVTASPKTGSGDVGTLQCVTATVDDQNGKPFPGASVGFTVTGANSTSGSRSTGANGSARFCYTGTNTGNDTVKASVGELSDTATRTWTAAPPRPTGLSAAPRTGSADVGTEQCVTATLTDQNGSPLPNTSLDFSVTGVNSASGSQKTGADGTAQFCYTGTKTGDDTVTVSVGDRSASVTRTWTTAAAPPPPPPPAPPKTDVSVAIAGPAYARVGANIIYTDTVSNGGPDTATGVESRSPIPSGTSLVSTRLSNGNTCTAVGGTITCFVGTLASGASVTATIVLTATQTGSVTQSATVQGDYDTNSSNNSASTTTPIIAQDAPPPPPPAPPAPGEFNAISTGTVTVNGVAVNADQLFLLHSGDTVDVTNGTITISDFDGGFGTFGNVQPSPQRRAQSRSAVTAPGDVPAVFTIEQAGQAGAGVTLTLTSGDFSVCSTPRRLAATNKTPVRQLWGKAHGLFTTKARYSSATIRGTIWLTQDRCDGSLTTAVDDVVDVVDFVKNTTISLQPGQSYLAQPKAAFKPPASQKSKQKNRKSVGGGLLTQTAATVRANGLVWGGRTFFSRADFTAWLVERGATWEQFTRNYPELAAALAAHG